MYDPDTGATNVSLLCKDKLILSLYFPHMGCYDNSSMGGRFDRISTELAVPFTFKEIKPFPRRKYYSLLSKLTTTALSPSSLDPPIAMHSSNYPLTFFFLNLD